MTLYIFDTVVGTELALFNPAVDTISFNNTYAAANLTLNQSGANTTVSYNNKKVTLPGINPLNLSGSQFVFDDGSLFRQGTSANDILSGSGGNDNLIGGAGDDLIDVGSGEDTLTGGAGNDHFFLTWNIFLESSTIPTITTITDFTDGDQIHIPGKLAPSHFYPVVFNNNPLNFNFSGPNSGMQDSVNARDGFVDVYWKDNIIAGRLEVWIDVSDDGLLNGSDNLIYLPHIGKTSLAVADFSDDFVTDLNPFVPFVLRGTARGEFFNGTVGNDEIYTLAGDDTLSGNLGNDLLFGGTGNDLINGNEGNDQLNGGSGSDTLNGGNGSDLLYADGENRAGSLFDSTGTVNYLNGGEGDDRLIGAYGNDILNGGLNADLLAGGLGNDIYIIDNKDDVITETSILATEIDSVNSTISYTLGTNLENLKLIGTDIINATGNSLHNILTGNVAANILNGKAGADTLIGSLGNDSYIVDNPGDIVRETSGLASEIDTVYSSVSYTLRANIEKLTLTGSAVINGVGNTLNNTITGNTADNMLNGGIGNDTLIGNNGADIFIGGKGRDTCLLTEKIDATDTLRIASGDSIPGSLDRASGFKLGTGGISTTGVDKLDLASNHISANAVAVNGIDSGIFHSHSITNGLIHFDDTDKYSEPLSITSANLSNVFSYLKNNITTNGSTVAFNAMGNTYVFQDGDSNDTLVQLSGVMADGISNTGLVAGSIWII